MTPPCRNCHGVPATESASESHRDLLEGIGRSAEFSLPTFEGPIDPEKKCGAQESWPDWLKKSYPDLQAHPFWVRTNFENTLKEHRLSQNPPWTFQASQKPILPFRIHVNRAELTGRLFPRSFTFGEYLGKKWVHIETVPGAYLSPHLQILNNRILLMRQGLLDLHGIKTGITSWLWGEVRPEKLSVGYDGGIHLALREGWLARGVTNLLTPWLLPIRTLGYDPPYLNPNVPKKCYDLLGMSPECPPPQYFETHGRSNAQRDFLLTKFLPPEFLDTHTGSLPLIPDLEEVILRTIQFFLNHPQTSQKKSAFDLRKIFTYLRPGSNLTLEIQDLKDLFREGILDVSSSYGRFTLELADEKNIQLSSYDFYFNLDPMDYAVPEGKRGWVRLNWGSLTPGPIQYDELKNFIPPGLELTYDTATSQARVSANLRFSCELEFPEVGKVAMDGMVLLQSTFQKTEEGLVLIPQTTKLKIGELNLLPLNGTPWATDLNLVITDDPEKQIRGTAEPLSLLSTPKSQIFITGMLKNSVSIDYQGILSLPLREDGSYDFSRILKDFNLKSVLQTFGEKNQHFKSHVSVHTVPADQPEGGPNSLGSDLVEPQIAYELDFDLLNGNSQKEKAHSLLAGAYLVFSPSHREGHDYFKFKAGAESLEMGAFSLQGLKGNLEIERAKLSEQVSKVVIPVLDFRVNEAGSSRGLLQGLAYLTQTEGKDLVILWDRPKQELTVENLDLALSVQQVRVLPKGVREFLGPRVDSVGLDGHVQADFSFSFQGPPSTWHGQGNFLLRGDRDGDVYLLDSHGRKIANIFRNTRWQIRNIHRIDTKGRYALGSKIGDMTLDTLSNLGVLTGMGSKEVPSSMFYNNQPVDLEGFYNRNRVYIRDICAQTPGCRESVWGKKKASPTNDRTETKGEGGGE